MDASSRWFCLLVLLLVIILNQWDKYQLVYLSSTAVCTGPGQPCHGLATKHVTLCSQVSTAANSSIAECHICLQEEGFARINMQEATCTSTVQYGFLTGYAFTVLYVAGAVLGGVLADALQLHKSILVVALLIWSAAAAAQALATAWWHLLILRLILGAAESLATPTSQTILGRTFPPGSKGTALGMLSVGIYLGGGLSSLSILLATSSLGWRGTVLLGGIGGLLATPLVLLFVPSDDGCSPARRSHSYRFCGCGLCVKLCCSGSSESESVPALQGQMTIHSLTCQTSSASPMKETGPQPSNITVMHPPPASQGVLPTSCSASLALLRAVLEPGSAKWVFLAAGLRYMAGLSVGAFQPKFFSQQYPNNSSEYAVWNAVIIGVGGSLSSISGGFIADRLIVMQPEAEPAAGSKPQGCRRVACLSAFSWQNGSARRLLVPIVGSVLAIPPFALMVLSPAFTGSLAGLLFTYLGAECWFGPTLAFLFAQTPSSTHGTASGLFSLFANVIGSAGPAAVAGLIQGPFDGEVGGALFSVVGSAYVASVVAFLLAWRASSPAGSSTLAAQQGYSLVEPEQSAGAQSSA